MNIKTDDPVQSIRRARIIHDFSVRELAKSELLCSLEAPILPCIVLYPLKYSLKAVVVAEFRLEKRPSGRGQKRKKPPILAAPINAHCQQNFLAIFNQTESALLICLTDHVHPLLNYLACNSLVFQ